MALHNKKTEKFTTNVSLPKGHEERFLAKLDVAMPKKQKTISYYIKIAAVAILLLGLSGTAYFYTGVTTGHTTKPTLVPEGIGVTDIGSSSSSKNNQNQITLGDLSPDLKKIEDYYVANINVTLAGLNITKANQQLINGYMSRLAVLDKEYKNLTNELNTYGPNEQTVNALINNLQLRLQLLYRLKDKLNEFKNVKQNENNA